MRGGLPIAARGNNSLGLQHTSEGHRFSLFFFFFFLYHFIVRQVEPMMDFTCFTLKAGGKGDAAQGR